MTEFLGVGLRRGYDNAEAFAAAVDLKYGASGRYHWGLLKKPGAAAASINGDTMYALPFHVPGLTIDGLVFEVTTTGVGTLANIGLYEMLTTGLPGALIEEIDGISLASTGIKVATLAAARRMDRPFYVVLITNGAVTVRQGTMMTDLSWTFFGGANLNGSTTPEALSKASTYAATMPTPFGGPTTNGTGPVLGVRIP